MIVKFEETIRLDWGHEQVSRCSKVNQGIAISHECILNEPRSKDLTNGFGFPIVPKIRNFYPATFSTRLCPQLASSSLISI